MWQCRIPGEKQNDFYVELYRKIAWLQVSFCFERNTKWDCGLFFCFFKAITRRENRKRDEMFRQCCEILSPYSASFPPSFVSCRLCLTHPARHFWLWIFFLLLLLVVPDYFFPPPHRPMRKTVGFSRNSRKYRAMAARPDVVTQQFD